MTGIRWPKRVKLAVLPTPIQPLLRLSKILGGPEIFIKRDDLTGSAMTGNKVRKLEFLCAEAIQQGATTLMTCGGVQSNHARTTAVAAAQLGLESLLFLRGEKPPVYQANVLLDKLVGAGIQYITSEQYKRAGELMSQAEEEMARSGKRGYAIPEGGSNALGMWGYVNTIREVQRQESALDRPFDYIVSAVGSGGTFAGMVAGRKIFDVKAKIMGFNVCDSAEYFQDRVSVELAAFQERWGHRVSTKPSALNIIDGYVGKGYAISYPEELETIRLLAQTEGIILEHVYTGKAFHGLLDQIRKGRFKRKDRILFCHTGGIFGLFDGPERFQFQEA